MKNSVNLICIAVVLLTSCAKDQNANVSFNILSTQIGIKTASFSFSIDLQGGDVITESGILMSEERNPVFLSYDENNNGIYNDVIWVAADGAGSSKTASFSDLKEYTKYYYKPFCVVKGKIQYGTEDSITTLVPTGVTVGPAGGYVIYDDGVGGGIEMALEDIVLIDEYGYEKVTFMWGCNSTNVPGTSANIGTGQVNTDTINFYCNDSENAANLCSQYTKNGYSDWYLPSKNELIQANTTIASLGYGNFSGNSGTYYWSSTESDAYTAAALFMGGYTTTAVYQGKYYALRVRPFRSF
jgi:hypothetical protein